MLFEYKGTRVYVGDAPLGLERRYKSNKYYEVRINKIDRDDFQTEEIKRVIPLTFIAAANIGAAEARLTPQESRVISSRIRNVSERIFTVGVITAVYYRYEPNFRNKRMLLCLVPLSIVTVTMPMRDAVLPNRAARFFGGAVELWRVTYIVRPTRVKKWFLDRHLAELLK